VVGYAENVVPKYLEEDFHAHFRLSNAVYKLIVERLDPRLSREHCGGIEQVSLYFQNSPTCSNSEQSI
jgi:hypothetical protein